MPKTSIFCFSESRAAHPNRTKGFNIVVDISHSGKGENCIIIQLSRPP